MARHFDLRKQLKLHDNFLLKRLFSSERPMNQLDWCVLSTYDVDPIAEAWDNLAEDRKRHFQVVLQDVNELADPRGQKVLLQEMEWRHPNKLERFGALKSPADKALWAFLEANNAFDQAAIFARAESLRQGAFSNRWNSLPKQPLQLTPEKIAMLEHEVRSFYWIQEMRGQVCKINHHRRLDGADYFFAYLPDWPDKELFFDDDENLTAGEFSLAFNNVFVFDPKYGAIDLIARGGLKVQSYLRQAFCKSILGIDVDDEKPLKPSFQLDHLLESNFVFTTEPSDRIAEVRLRRLRWIPKIQIPFLEGDELKFRQSTRLSDIQAVIRRTLAAHGLSADSVTVTHVAIQLVFRLDDDRKPKTMTFHIGCPNSCDLKTRPEEYQIVGDRCLAKWGIICG